MIDLDGDGVISLKELKNLVEKCGKEISDEEVLDMVRIFLKINPLLRISLTLLLIS